MKLSFARFISALFHPVIFATVAPFILLHNLTRDIFFSIKWMTFSAGFIFLALLAFLLLRPKDFLKDFDLSDRKKRPIFYVVLLFVAVLYFFISVDLKGLFFPLSIVSLGIIIGVILFEIVNIYLKVSIHTAVATAFVITFAMFHGPMSLLITIWIPLGVMWSRIILKKHTFQEALVGMCLGGTITLLTFAIGKLLL